MLATYYSGHHDKLCSDCRIRLERNPLRLLDCKVETCRALGDEAPKSADHLCADCQDHWTTVQGYLKVMGIPYSVDHRLVRGLDYYTRTVFEVQPLEGGAQSTIVGGGRYDGLLAALGSVDLPATGFGMGDVVLSEILRSRAEGVGVARRLDAFIVGVTSDDAPHVWGLAHRLRDNAISVEFSLRSQPIAKQLKLAAAREARRALIIGPDERTANEIVVKQLATGEEMRVASDVVLQRSFWREPDQAPNLVR